MAGRIVSRTCSSWNSLLLDNVLSSFSLNNFFPYPNWQRNISDPDLQQIDVDGCTTTKLHFVCWQLRMMWSFCLQLFPNIIHSSLFDYYWLTNSLVYWPGSDMITVRCIAWFVNYVSHCHCLPRTLSTPKPPASCNIQPTPLWSQNNQTNLQFVPLVMVPMPHWRTGTKSLQSPD